MMIFAIFEISTRKLSKKSEKTKMRSPLSFLHSYEVPLCKFLCKTVKQWRRGSILKIFFFKSWSNYCIFCPFFARTAQISLRYPFSIKSTIQSRGGPGSFNICYRALRSIDKNYGTKTPNFGQVSPMHVIENLYHSQPSKRIHIHKEISSLRKKLLLTW